MNFNNYYIWPKSFVEDSLENTSRDTKPEVSKYISKILKEEINELQEEELEKGDVAQNLIMQADLMEEDSKRLLNEAMLKREEAYALDPKLRKPGRPKKVQAIEEEADE